MKTTFLSSGSRSEIAELTGAQRRPRQIEALTRMGLKFFVGIDGWPRIARSQIEGETATGYVTEPDFSSLDKGKRAP